MNQADWKRIKQSRMKRGMVDLILRKISREEYEKIVDQTYEEYRGEAHRPVVSPHQNFGDGAGRLVSRS